MIEKIKKYKLNYKVTHMQHSKKLTRKIVSGTRRGHKGSSRSTYSFIFALMLGVFLAVGASVWATSIGNNVSVSNNLSASGKLTISGTSASSSIAFALGVGTTTPEAMFSVGGAAGNTSGHGYFTGGLGVGIVVTTSGRIVANADLGVATTTPAQELSVVGDGYFTGGFGVGIATTSAGTIENTGSALFGDASTDVVRFNTASLIFNNAGTSTLPVLNADAWSFATSTANVPLIKLDTANNRVGIGTTTPGATLAVNGDGTFLVMGGATSSIIIQSTSGGTRGGCIEVESTAGDGTRFSLMATGAGPVFWTAGGCR